MIQGYFNKFHPNVLCLYLHNWDYAYKIFKNLNICFNYKKKH